ncbi:MAG TPA: alkaline phosphatase family protein [Gemmatimonadales bacterium]
MISTLLALLLTGAPPSPKPRLVVVITVDQLRPDYLTRWRPQLTGGLRRLITQGAVFTEAYQEHAITETAPGHATVLSGRWPAHTGIVSNDLGVLDRSAPLVDARGVGASPSRFTGTALFDWLKAREPGARALSVSRKDRGAILPIGRAKEHVYWYSDSKFTTSTYYRDSLPSWVLAFNALGVQQKYAGRSWTLLRPDSAYAELDDQPWEDPQGSFGEKTFPHAWPDDSARSAAAFPARPEMDSLTLALALSGADALQLGRRGATDLLAVSLSTLDAVGHTFGPSSREVHDMVLRLDRYLGWFLDRLYRRYGRDRVVIALTADHGVSPYPAEARAAGRAEARAVSVDTLVAAVNAEMGSHATVANGTSEFLFDSGILFLQNAPALRAAGVDVDSVVAAVGARLRAVPGVARADEPAALASADTAADAVARRWLHQLPDDLPVALVVTLDDDAVWGNESYAMHGRPADVDARVPLILVGPGVKRGAYGGRVATVDLAPTLARLLGLTPAEPLDGRILREALAN